MSTERLSRLQKWILTEAWKRGRRNLCQFPPGIIGMEGFIDKYWIGTADVHREYFGNEKAEPMKAVILCRSAARLGERGYFEARRYRHDFGQLGGDVQFVLSKKGIDKAKSIMAGQNTRGYTIREAR